MSHRIGRVTERDAATARVRVEFTAVDAVVSWWLPVLVAKSLDDRAYWMPDVGEQVVCLFDEHEEFGVVLGAIYSRADAPPVANLDALHVAFKDGSTFEYDRAAHRLAIHLAGGASTIEISAEADVTVSAGGNATVAVPAGANVFVGGADAPKRLATEEFVTSIYLQHKHPTPTGLSGPPIATGTETAWPQVTQKGVSE